METSLTLPRIRDLAPVVKIHSHEINHPCDPVIFIKNARFRHHRKLRRDLGYNKVENKWIKTNSHDPAYYDIPVEIIDAKGFYPCGKNRRPRDKNRGKHTYFLETKDPLRGNAENVIKTTIPAYYRIKGTFLYPDISETDEINSKDVDFILEHLQGVKEGSEINLLKFFFFYGYNSYFLIWGANHQGDWEHISVAICDGKINFVIFHHHGLKKLFYPNELEMEDGHFVVYSALGTHGNYRSRGTKIVYPKGILTIDFCNSNGYSWKCYENLQPIGDMDQELMSSGSQPLSYLKQLWQNYAGAWGAVGKFDFTTGPLGPIRKKF